MLSVLLIGANSAPSMAQDEDAQMENDWIANIYISPLGLLLGSANLSAEFKVAKSFTLGPKVSYGSVSSGTLSATNLGFGAEAAFYLGNPAFTDSWFINPFFEYISTSRNSLSSSGFGLGVNFNYGWFWESGFNIALGLGIQYRSVDYTEVGLSSISAILPSVRFSLGFAF